MVLAVAVFSFSFGFILACMVCFASEQVELEASARQMEAARKWDRLSEL